MARWPWEIKTLAFARQTDYWTENTTGGEFTAAVVEVDAPEFVRSLEAFKSATGQTGAFDPPAVGSKHGGKFKLRSPVYGYKSGYNGAVDVPGTDAGVCSPIMVLLANALGSNAGTPTAAEFARGTHLAHAAYAAAAVAVGSTTAVLIVTDAAGFVIGRLVLTSTADDGTVALAWIKNSVPAGGPPDTVTYYDAIAAADVAANLDDAFPTSTAWLSSNTQVPLTIRMLGDNAAFGVAFIGCVATAWKIEAKAGATPTVEIEYSYTDKRWDTSIGGLLATAAFIRTQPLLGANGARLTYGNSGGGASQCGVTEFEVSCQYQISYTPCHGKAQGVSEAIVTERRIKASFLIPHDSADTVTAGEHAYENDLANGTAKTLGVYVGKTAGKIWSMLLPSVHHVEQPKLVDRDGLLYWQLSMEPGTYYADGTAGAVGTAPADTIFRLGWG